MAKKRQLEEAKRVMELDRNLIAIAVIITALPIIAALGLDLTALAVGDGTHSSGSSSILAAILRALAGCMPGGAHYYFNSFVARKLVVAGMPRPAEIGALSICIMAL